MRGAWRQEEGERAVETACILPCQPARGIELLGRNLRRWVHRGQQRLDRERRRVTVQARDHAEGGLAAQGNPNRLTHPNGILQVVGYGVAEQAIATRPCARDSNFGDRCRRFRRREECSATPQVYWPAESARIALVFAMEGPYAAGRRTRRRPIDRSRKWSSDPHVHFDARCPADLAERRTGQR